jgi:thiamine-monophosphate kinase
MSASDSIPFASSAKTKSRHAAYDGPWKSRSEQPIRILAAVLAHSATISIMPGLRNEFALIEWIRQQTSGHPRLAVGIGDDAAVLRFPEPAQALVTVDMLMEGVDFLLDAATPQQIGRKSLAVNLSDIAAMAGLPVAAVVAVSLPQRGGAELAMGLQQGIQQLAKEFNVAIAGGDTNTWNGPLVVSITVVGEAVSPGPVLRSGAQPGDWICATGSFGGSISGKHLDFTPRIREAAALHQAVRLHAMIDVSDGLAADLGHILDESHVGAILDAEKIPISQAALETDDRRTPLEHALGDGEDFELLFTVSPGDGQSLLDANPCGVAVTRIGEIVPGGGCQLRGRDGKLSSLAALGWKHPFDQS